MNACSLGRSLVVLCALTAMLLSPFSPALHSAAAADGVGYECPSPKKESRVKVRCQYITSAMSILDGWRATAEKVKKNPGVEGSNESVTNLISVWGPVAQDCAFSFKAQPKSRLYNCARSETFATGCIPPARRFNSLVRNYFKPARQCLKAKSAEAYKHCIERRNRAFFRRMVNTKDGLSDAIVSRLKTFQAEYPALCKDVKVTCDVPPADAIAALAAFGGDGEDDFEDGDDGNVDDGPAPGGSDDLDEGDFCSAQSSDVSGLFGGQQSCVPDEECKKPTPTPASTPPVSNTPYYTPTWTPTWTPTLTPSVTPTRTPTTPVPTPTRTSTPRATSLPTTIPTAATPRPSASATTSPTRTATIPPTKTATRTATATPVRTSTATPFRTATPTRTATASATSTRTTVPTRTATPVISNTPVRTATPVFTTPPMWTVIYTSTPTATVTRTITPAATGTWTATTPVATRTSIPSPGATAVPFPSVSPLPVPTMTALPYPTWTAG